jgi:hypothetical protein
VHGHLPRVLLPRVLGNLFCQVRQQRVLVLEVPVQSVGRYSDAPRDGSNGNRISFPSWPESYVPLEVSKSGFP